MGIDQLTVMLTVGQSGHFLSICVLRSNELVPVDSGVNFINIF